MRRLPGWFWTLLFSLLALGVGLLAPTFLQGLQTGGSPPTPTDVILVLPSATSTVTPFVVAQAEERTPEASATNTLMPPPTLEPPTSTPPGSPTPSLTPTLSVIVTANVEGIQGLPSPTVQGEPECEPRDDWTLEYTVQANETLSSIATHFNTYASTLAEGNCLDDPDMVRVGQVILVPGESLPVEPDIVCEEYVQLQPIEGAWGVPGTGQLVFNWEGTQAPRNLLRLYPPDFDFNNPDPDEWIEYTFDLRQNHTVDLIDIPEAGTWRWQVYPLDSNFQQVCPESPLWYFTKEEGPTPTPTLTPSPTNDPNATPTVSLPGP